MSERRRYVLGGLLVLTAAVAAVILSRVLATVFFTITVAYLLFPVREALAARGLSHRWASVAATLAALTGAIVVLAPLALILVLRLGDLLAFLETIPEEVVLRVLGFEYVVTLEQALAVLSRYGRTLAQRVALEAPIVAVKFALFVLLLYSLVSSQDRIRRALIAVVPPAFRDVADALNRRARETLFAIYVLQAATAVGTFAVALPVFLVLGYDFPVTLAVVAAVLQFLPIVGPSVLLVALAVSHLAVGQYAAAAVVLVVGGFVIAWLPDVLIRPWLARETASLPGSLYFVGFTGGILSLGAIGIIAGPLVVALLAELAALLAADMNDSGAGDPVGDGGRLDERGAAGGTLTDE